MRSTEIPTTWSGPEEFRPLLTPINDLVPAPGNAKTHDEYQIERLAYSLERWGQRKTVVAQRNSDGTTTLRAGHGTRLAALLLGWTHLAAVGFDDDDVEARAFALADNRLGELSGWDPDALQLEIEELGDDFAAADLGWEAADLALIGIRTSPAPEAQVDPEPQPPPSNPTTRTGDLYSLGPHRLLCGDATSSADVARLLGGVVPLLMVTDPPYGVSYDPNWRLSLGKVRGSGRVPNDHRADWSDAWVLFPGAIAYTWSPAGDNVLITGRALQASGFEIRSMLMWRKPRAPISRGAYHWGHEPCWYAVRKGRTAKWCGDRKQNTVWDIPHVPGGNDTGHATQKPVECMARPMRHHGTAGDYVYDPFLGSGTSLIAAQREDRFCLAMEIDPGYCDVAVSRWEKYTGHKATREGGD